MTPSHEALHAGELTVIGRIRSASNATFLCEAQWAGLRIHCVYKPVAGEQPLWDFPDGTLAGREVGAYLVSESLGWNIVPHTIIRDGPAGRGMVQRWIEEPDDASTDTKHTGPDPVDLCSGRQGAVGLPVGVAGLRLHRRRSHAGPRRRHPAVPDGGVRRV